MAKCTKNIILLGLAVIMIACTGNNDGSKTQKQEYPKSAQQKREERTGSFTSGGKIGRAHV